MIRKKLICKIFKHYLEIYPYQEVGWSIPEPRYMCKTCGEDFEEPEMEEWAGIGILLHKIISFFDNLWYRFKYQDIPF